MKGWQDENGGKDIKNRCLSQTGLENLSSVYPGVSHKRAQTF